MCCHTYPNSKGIQKLCVVNLKTDVLTHVGKFKHTSRLRGKDIRCDLHPRWSEDGRFITIDTIHLGERKILLLDINQLQEK